MRLFTTGDVLRLTGLAPNTFDSWCREGVVQSVSGGHGTGNHRQFSLMQVVGIMVAVEVQNSERGCTLLYVHRVIEAFIALDEAELLKRFDEGLTHFLVLVSTATGKTFLDLGGPRYSDMIDVQRIYRQATKASTKGIEPSNRCLN